MHRLVVLLLASLLAWPAAAADLSGGIVPTGRISLPDPVSIGLAFNASPEIPDRVEAFHSGAAGAKIVDCVDAGAAGLVPRIEATVAATVVPSGLPVIEFPTAAWHGTMAIVICGDGGWPDPDSTIAGYLQEDRVPTVGRDTLRHFWSKRTSEETARDRAGLIRHYTEAWETPNALIGYSFGADVLPATYIALDPESRSRVSQISFLGVAPKAHWEIAISGWLGTTIAAATDTGPAPTDLPPALFQCLYGEAETDSPCPNVPGIEVVRATGGHHSAASADATSGQVSADKEAPFSRLEPSGE